MADITISDLELAPALTDDMVLPVENTTDTYAATLAMLRRLINKTFVEVENADFNALTDDGFYQCTGTPTNSPVAGAINWTLQVSAESGVVVQRAFSLDDNFANLYIRRWNGVTWTAWLEVGAGALANKANVSNTVTTDTAQTISGFKSFSDGALRAVNPYLLKENNADEGGQINFERSDNSVLRGHPLIDLFINTIRFIGVNSNNTTNVTLQVDLENNKVYIPTPPDSSIGYEVVNAGWFRQAGCTARTVIETYKNGDTWYRIWSDGWKEQGGTNSGALNINFPIAFSDTSYSLLISRTNSSENVVYAAKSANTYFGVGWKIGGQGFNANTTSFSWFACGY